MYRWSELRALVEQCDADVVVASASNWASLGDPAAVERVTTDPQRWNVVLEQEITACGSPVHSTEEPISSSPPFTVAEPT